jgi:hypothetical protein
MQRYRRLLRRRTVLHLVDWLVIVLLFIVWIVAVPPSLINHAPAPTTSTWHRTDRSNLTNSRKPVPTGRAISYNKAPGHIIVQIAKLPGLTGAEMHTVPLWTLYGDGTLIFRTDPSDALWRAQLAPGDIQHILDVILNQGRFFEDMRKQYGSDNELLLTVDANGQQKKVVLASELTNQAASDIQTIHTFVITQFLLAYHPAHSELYALNPDLGHNSGDGR